VQHLARDGRLAVVGWRGRRCRLRVPGAGESGPGLALAVRRVPRLHGPADDAVQADRCHRAYNGESMSLVDWSVAIMGIWVVVIVGAGLVMGLWSGFVIGIVLVWTPVTV